MEIRNSEWTEFAEFIADQSTHMISSYWDDGCYTKCPFSTIERAYTAFQVWKQTHSGSEVRKFWDIDVKVANPEYDERPDPIEDQNEYYEYLQEQAEIEDAYIEAAGLYSFDIANWNPEWDNYCADREKQITRIAHELADRHERLSIMEWVSLVYPFYDLYGLNSDERCLFTQEYSAQHFFRYGYV